MHCADCGREARPDRDGWLCECGGLWSMEPASFDPAQVDDALPGLWRYSHALPVECRPELSLGEGMTPMVPMRFGERDVLVKQEQLFPTGSYKDRGAAVMMNHAAGLGVKEVVEDSSGNAGCAVAAYSARAGIRARIFVPADTSPAKLAQIRSYGAELELVPGSRENTARACMEAASGGFYASHVYNPYFFQGTKTFAYEIAEGLGWSIPDALVLPVGNGTMFLGACIGFRELVASGVVEQMPALIGVQAEHCAPLALAESRGSDRPEAIEGKPTLAEGIAIAEPARGKEILAAVRESRGFLVTVSEEEIKAAREAMSEQGFYIEPTSCVVPAALDKLGDRLNGYPLVVAAFSGHGLKAAGK